MGTYPLSPVLPPTHKKPIFMSIPSRVSVFSNMIIIQCMPQQASSSGVSPQHPPPDLQQDPQSPQHTLTPPSPPETPTPPNPKRPPSPKDTPAQPGPQSPLNSQDLQGPQLNEERIIYPRDLSIAGADDRECWRWYKYKQGPTWTELDSSSLTAERKTEGVLAELPFKRKGACAIDVKGKYDTLNLTPCVIYEVSLRLSFSPNFLKHSVRLKLKLDLPDGTSMSRDDTIPETFSDRPPLSLVIGRFTATTSGGEIKFSVVQVDKAEKDKQFGLKIDSVRIRPASGS